MAETADAPYSDTAVFIVERRYAALGCGTWNSRKVQLLCAKFQDTPRVMAARMRLKPHEFIRRLEENVWSKQDQLILTILEREIDFMRGGKKPETLV